MGKLLGCSLIASGIAIAGLTLPFADRLDARAALGGTPDVAGISASVESAPPPVARLAAVGARKPIFLQAPDLPTDPATLTRTLLQELRRVGCYEGDVGGVWGPAARKAMKAFTERVNATLPVDRPDQILLSLVSAEQGRVCGTPCPAGQAQAEGGRCLPQAIVAHAPRPATTRVASLTPASSVASPPLPPLPSAPSKQFESETPRMGLAGPVAADPLASPKPEAKSAEAAKAERAARERKARHERERRYVRASKPASFGQTRWAREFFRRMDGDVF